MPFTGIVCVYRLFPRDLFEILVGNVFFGGIAGVTTSIVLSDSTVDTFTIFGLEWHRWLFFFFAWVPWLIIEIWYFVRMKARFREDDPLESDDRGEDRSDGV